MTLKVIFANSVDPEQSDQGPQCLHVSKLRFEKFTRIFSRRHKQTTFSDQGFLGILRVNRVLRRHFQTQVFLEFLRVNRVLVIFTGETFVLASCLLFFWKGVYSIAKSRLFKYIENFTTKKWKLSDEKILVVFIFCSRHTLWVLVRTASARRF